MEKTDAMEIDSPLSNPLANPVPPARQTFEVDANGQTGKDISEQIHTYNKELKVVPRAEIEDALEWLELRGFKHILHQWRTEGKFCGYNEEQLNTIAEMFPLCVKEGEATIAGGWSVFNHDRFLMERNIDPFTDKARMPDFFKLFMHIFHTYPNIKEYPRILQLLDPEQTGMYNYVQGVIAIHFNFGLQSWDCEEEVRDAFKNLDLDRDGEIHYDEFVEFMTEVLKEKITPEEVKQIAETLSGPKPPDVEDEYRTMKYEYYVKQILPNRVTRSYRDVEY